MRIRLLFSVIGNRYVLPINYQYEFSAWIYKILYQGDKVFASWLHKKGYEYGTKRFKLFTFSQLETSRYRVFNDRYKILSNEAELLITFHIDEAAQRFITGLFKNREFIIGDKKSQVNFEVQSAETLQEPDFQEVMTLTALSPICVGKPVDREGKLYTKYLLPDDKEFEERLIDNLCTRYKATNGNGSFDRGDINVEVLSRAKPRLIKIKADTPAQTRVKGSLFDFRCKAPKELLQLGYESGFGEKNSLGFGCVEIK